MAESKVLENKALGTTSSVQPGTSTNELTDETLIETSNVFEPKNSDCGVAFKNHNKARKQANRDALFLKNRQLNEDDSDQELIIGPKKSRLSRKKVSLSLAKKGIHVPVIDTGKAKKHRIERAKFLGLIPNKDVSEVPETELSEMEQNDGDSLLLNDNNTLCGNTPPSQTGGTPHLDNSISPMSLEEDINSICSKHSISPALETDLRALLNKVTQYVTSMQERFQPVPQSPTYASMAAKGSEASSNMPYKTVKGTNKRKDGSGGAQPSTSKRVAPSPSSVQQVPTETPKPRPQSTYPAVIIKPTSLGISSPLQLRELVEESINPKTLGIQVRNCKQAHGNGVIVQLQDSQDTNKLIEAINSHPSLKDKCTARLPRGRFPQIIVFDIDKTELERSVEEERFLDKLRRSNELPNGEMKVLYRKRGRANRENWVLLVHPDIFRKISGQTWLRSGLGSYKFMEHVEPQRCFKCHRFGHMRKKCPEKKEKCSRCTGTHNYKECTRDTPLCRNCVAYNKVTKSGLQADHPATWDKCPMFLRERDHIRSFTLYG